ncbi:MAG TPA: hypothetical protein VE136_18025, partial [Anaerolineales bacterium]|nr:hypothetical protein [Anaerolineales bacterium]
LHTVLHKEFRMRKAWRRLIGPGQEKSNRLDFDSASRSAGLAVIKVLLKNALTLPLARWRLNRLTQAPYQGLELLPQSLTPEEAARPSPQPAPPFAVSESFLSSREDPHLQ